MDHLKPSGGEATVASVDKPDLCLRIRSGPSSSFDKVGCAELGQKLELTGIWSSRNWAQVQQPVSGWVYAGQIESDLHPSRVAVSTRAAPQPRVLTSTGLDEDSDGPFFNERRYRRWERRRSRHDLSPGSYGEGSYYDDPYYYGSGPYNRFGRGGGIQFRINLGGKK